MSEHYKCFPFTVSLGFETQIAVIHDILESVYREGIRKVFIMNGHDGNIAPIEVAARTAKVAHPDFKILSLDAWWMMVGEVLPPDFFEVWNGLGHGARARLRSASSYSPSSAIPPKRRASCPGCPSSSM